jgi:hypothetical protein
MRRTWPLILLIGAALPGCSYHPLADLPSIEKLPEKVLSKDDQAAKAKELSAKGQSHQSEAAQQIESTK